MPRQKNRTKLTRERILNTAIQFADTQGLDSLSMRTLAKELGFGVMSLYNHVKDKDDLYQGMVAAVTQEIELPGPDAPWKKGLRRCIVSAYLMMINHPWLPGIWGSSLCYEKNRYHDTVLRLMRDAGFPEELACRGFHALTMHVVGFSLQVMEMPFADKQELRAFARQHLVELEEQQLPYLREHVEFHLAGKDKRSDFKYMLDLILDGLEKDFADA